MYSYTTFVSHVSVYAPNDDSDMDSKDRFNESLLTQLKTVGKEEELLFLGNLNTMTGNKFLTLRFEDLEVVLEMIIVSRMIELCDSLSLKSYKNFCL